MSFGTTHGFAAGPYSVTFNSVAMGLMVGDQQSPTLEIVDRTQLITNTHRWARTVIGAVGQGAEAFANLVLMEYSATLMAVFWPWGSLGKMSAISADRYDAAASLVLTAVAGTLAASAGPSTRTATKAILAEDFPLRYLKGPILRETPIRMRLFPDDTTNQRFWVDT